MCPIKATPAPAARPFNTPTSACRHAGEFRKAGSAQGAWNSSPSMRTASSPSRRPMPQSRQTDSEGDGIRRTYPVPARVLRADPPNGSWERSVEPVKSTVLPVVEQDATCAPRGVHRSCLCQRVDDLSGRVEDGHAKLDGAPFVPRIHVEAVEYVVGTSKRHDSCAVTVEADLHSRGAQGVVRST